MRSYATWLLLALLSVPSIAWAGPDRDVMSEHIWLVTLRRGTGALFCEAAATGRDRQAGDYTIRFRRMGDRPLFGVSYAGPPANPADEMHLFIDSERMGKLTLERGETAPGQQTVWGSMTAAHFDQRVTPALEAHGAFMLTLVIGDRVFETPIFGFGTVRAAYNTCMADAAQHGPRS